jgi:transcription initiation factor TFIID subunit 9B
MSRQTAADTLPPTARAIALLLASTPTVQDAQPGVLHQLLEFAHRYTTQVLSDAQVYADHAGRAGKIDMDDVVLAVQARVGWEFGGRVPKEVRIQHCSRYYWKLIAIFALVHTLIGIPDKCNTPACRP